MELSSRRCNAAGRCGPLPRPRPRPLTPPHRPRPNRGEGAGLPANALSPGPQSPPGGVRMASRRPEGFPRELLTSDETILLELKPSAVPFVIAPALAMSTIIVVFLLGFASLAVVSIPLAIRSCGLPLVVFAILLVITSYIGYLTWLNTFYAVTDKRVLQKSGLIGMN